MIKFIHAADIHLDSPLEGLSNRLNLPVEKIISATREALSNLVNLAIEEKVDFVLLAGDIYDGDYDDFTTAFYFNQQMGRLNQKNIEVVMISGNHDAKSRISKPLTPPENVKVLSVEQPESHEIVKNGEVIAVIHGQGFLHQAETTNLATTYPSPWKGKLNIGILHTSLQGYEGHDNYAPTSLNELANKGYNYWALGHIHKREEFLRESCWIVFPGNIQGRHIKETGAKGCYLVKFENSTQAKLEFKPLDVFRWEVLTVNVEGMEDESGLQRKVIDALNQKTTLKCPEVPFGVRLILQGKTNLHSWLVSSHNRITNNIQNIFDGFGAGNLFLEELKVATCSAHFDAVAVGLGEDALSLIAKTMESMVENSSEFEKLLKDTDLVNLNKAVPGDWKGIKDPNSIEPLNPDWLKELLGEIVPLIEATAKAQEQEI
jgi:exonuclease SbcD